eukprot:ANDGO_04216.mRNA.1 putative 5-formyltetrahydrofolate cyclo-ligase
MSVETISHSKKALRRVLAQKLSTISLEVIDLQSKQLFDRLENCSLFRNVSSISLYMSMPGQPEIQTLHIARRILELGKTLFVPVVPIKPGKALTSGTGTGTNGRRQINSIDTCASANESAVPFVDELDMVEVSSISDLSSFVLNKWGIPEPVRDDSFSKRRKVWDIQQLELVLCPGFAFTTAGDRLGHGKGYYDKFLKKCYSVFPNKPQTIALSLREQILNDIPVSDFDVRMDWVMTPDSMYCSNNTSNDPEKSD